MQRRFEGRPRLNNQIREAQVQVIDSQGKSLGTMATHEALALAIDQGLDLVEIGPQAKPPIAKILDYGKYTYQKERSEKKHKAAIQEIKTVKIGFRTEKHDLAIRSGQADKFLAKGHKVKVELKLRGREKQMQDLGKKKLEDFLTLLSVAFSLEAPIKGFPGGFSTLIKPEKNK